MAPDIPKSPPTASSSPSRGSAWTPDRDRISLGEDHDVRDWIQSLGVSEAELREAVDAVGNSAEAVPAYLKKS